MSKRKSITLKDINEFAKENGLPEDVELFVFGRSRLLPVVSISTEQPGEDALYTDIYLEVAEEQNSQKENK